MPFCQKCPFALSVIAPGYKTWYYADKATGKNLLKLTPDESRDLGTINLIPTAIKSPQSLERSKQK